MIQDGLSIGEAVPPFEFRSDVTMNFILLSASARHAATVARLLNTFDVVVLDTTPEHARVILAEIAARTIHGMSKIEIDRKGEPAAKSSGKATTIHVLDAQSIDNPSSAMWPIRRFASEFGKSVGLGIGVHDRLIVLVDGLKTHVPHGIEGEKVAVVQVEGVGQEWMA